MQGSATCDWFTPRSPPCAAEHQRPASVKSAIGSSPPGTLLRLARSSHLAMEHGMSTFILISHNPNTIELFGREVAPSLHEAVGRERGTDVASPRT